MRPIIVAAALIVAFAVVLAASLTLSPEMPWALFVPLALVLMLASLAVVALAAAGSVPAIVAVLIVVVFVTDGNFRVRAEGATGSDWQGLLKFAIWTTGGVIGLAHLPQIARRSSSWGAGLLLAYIGFAMISASYAPSPALSFGYAFSLLCLYAFTTVLTTRLTEATILWTVALTLAVFIAIGWLVYYGDPELGQFKDVTGDGFIFRMSGLAGQPVNLGSVCAIFLCAVFLLVWQRRCRVVVALPLIALGLATLAATNSRTGLIAAAAGMLAVIFSRSSVTLTGVGLLVALGLGCAFSFTIQLDSIASYFARSGDASETFTLTGRTEIWDFTWRKILESPLFGWGYNSSTAILGQHIGFGQGTLTIESTHNLLLQNLLSVGVIGTIPLVGLLVKLVLDMARGRPAPISVLFLVMAFVAGITDPSALGETPTLLTLMFMLASIWPSSPAYSPRHVTVRR